jgi:hypothetical protein
VSPGGPAHPWNCIAEGLIVNLGDNVQMAVSGTAR